MKPNPELAQIYDQVFNELLFTPDSDKMQFVLEEAVCQPAVVPFMRTVAEKYALSPEESGLLMLISLGLCKADRLHYGEQAALAESALTAAHDHIRPLLQYMESEDQKGMQQAYKVFYEHHPNPAALSVLNILFYIFRMLGHHAGREILQKENEFFGCVWTLLEALEQSRNPA